MSIPGGLLEPLQQHDTKSIPYTQWLQQWLSHLTPTSLFSKTPLQASHIHTPIIHATWLHHLWHHPHQDLVQYFLQCISSGFRVWFDGSGTYMLSKDQSSKCCCSPYCNRWLYSPWVITWKDIWPIFTFYICPDVHINRFGVIPKNYQQDKWRLITDLSYPSGSSVNDGIPSQLCSLTYVTIDDTILNILKSGKNNTGKGRHRKFLLFITSAPSRPISTQDEMERSDIHWSLYPLWTPICTQTIQLSFWSSSMDCSECRCLIHYLDDYLTIGSPASTVCQHNVDTFVSLCAELQVPIATDKLESPSTSLSFLDYFGH